MLPISGSRFAPVADVLPLYDANLFCGNYPFRKLPADTPDSLAAFVKQAGLSGCVLTPFESVFYRQPLDGLRPWLEAKLELPFEPLFWLVINPLLPRWETDLATGTSNPRVAGIRLFPRYHGYSLDHPLVADVVAAAAAQALPINLTARLLDDRLHPYPFRVDDPLPVEAVVALLQQQPQAHWVLSFFQMAELAQIAPALTQNPNLYFDIGCGKPFEFWEDDIRALGPVSQMIYGSGAPLYYHLGNRFSLCRSGFTPGEKQSIFAGNLQRLLSQGSVTKELPL